MEVIHAVGVVSALIIGGYLLIAFQVCVMVFLSGRVTSARIRVDEHPNVRALARYNTWAAANGFELLGTYRALGVPTAVWLSKAECTYLCIYSIGAVDIATDLTGQNDVTTCTNRGALLFPSRPGVWKQVITNRNLDDVLRLHREAVSYLRGRLRIDYAKEMREFPNAMAESMRLQMAHVRSLPLWPLRWPYWYFVRPWKLVNKTIREQLKTGLVP
jgi:hypothetical protein